MEPTSKENKKHRKEEEIFERRALDINNLTNKLLTFNYQTQFNTNFVSDIDRFFDELIWAENNHPSLVRQLFDMQILSQINDLYASQQQLLRNYIILFTNLKHKGLLAQLLLDNRLMTDVLRLFVGFSIEGNEEAIEYLGSFLKMYQRMFCKEWIHRFIDEEGYFELLEISFKFYNCSELITRTSVLNIVFSLLSYQEVKDYLATNQTRTHFYQYILGEFTKQFKQQLASFSLRLSHTSKEDDIQIIFRELEDKISFWEDLSCSIKGCENLFHQSFMRNIILPLLVGPFHCLSQSLFTLKFSLYILKKLIPVIYNFRLIEPLIKILFIDDKVVFWPSSLKKSIMVPFKLEALLDKSLPHEESQSLKELYEQELEEIQQLGDKVKQFYLNIFRSKDHHFILMSSTLLSSIIEVLRKNKQLEILKECHLQQFGKLNYMFNQVLINHLSEPHRLNTLIFIIDTLVYLIQHDLDENLQYQFMEILKSNIRQCLETLTSLIPYLEPMVEVLEYDIKTTDTLKLGTISMEKFEENCKIVFAWDPLKQEESEDTFYASIPDTFEENVRHCFVKFLILRRGCTKLITGVELGKMTSQYYSIFISKSQYILGDIYKLNQIKEGFQCELVEGKQKYPILIIKDQNYLVIAYLDKLKKETKIIATLKLKHIEIEKLGKRDKDCCRIQVRDFNYRTQRIRYKNPIELKNCQNSLRHIPALQQLCRQRQVNFIKKVLQSTLEGLPSISLI